MALGLRSLREGRRPRLGHVLLALLFTPACRGTPPPDQGAVVEACEPWGAAAEAALAPGDVLVGWSRPGTAGGAIGSPFDVTALEAEQSPRGPVTIRYWRDGALRDATLRRGEWALRARPRLPDTQAARQDEAARLAGEGDLERARRLWSALASEADGDGRAEDALWIGPRIARAHAEKKRPEAAEKAFAAARQGLTDPRLRAAALDLEGEWLAEAGRDGPAAAAFAEAVALRETADPGSPSLAWSLGALGRARYRLLDLDGAEGACRRALAIYEDAGSAALESSAVLSVLASLAYYRGDLDQAETVYGQALARREPLAPGSPRMAVLQANLGLVAYDRGDLDVAERLFRRALATNERLEPRAAAVGYDLNFLGLVTRDKGDFEAARGYYTRALEIFRGARPGGTEVAGMLNNLGNLARREGDLDAAERHHREALVLRERTSPGSLDVAGSLNNLGTILRMRGRPAEARTLLERALAIKQRVVPDSLILATTLAELGEVDRLEGALDRAESRHRRALGLRRAIAPESDATAESLAAMGALARGAGRAAEAEARWQEAIRLIEARRGRLAFTTAERSRFTARFHDLYRDLAELLAERGRPAEAFDVLERARARALRVMMAQRELAGEAEVPADLLRERRRLEQALDRAESRLARLSRTGRGRITGIHESQRGLRRQLDAVQARIRDSAPRLARLEDPAPVTSADVQRELDPGTLLLSYSVGGQATLLFAASAGTAGEELTALALPAGETELERRVDVFRALIERGRTTAAVEPALVAQGRRLYEMLLAPVEERLARADRVVFVADGPLLTLPFGALVRSVEPVRYVSEWKPLSHAASAGVLIERARARPRAKGSRRQVVAFGDPLVAEDEKVRGRRRGRLPFARQEARRIGALFGDGARVLVGAEATEEAARALGPEAHVVHFATHAVPDARFPLDSALLLSPGPTPDEGADGRLHAWEIAGGPRLGADLVTLSGCETGLGRELHGEGILGLSRAFQYAGARSVLVSLWAVSDRSTAELMERFYAGLERGLAKDEALRAARRALLAAPLSAQGAMVDARHPYHWAAFRLLGDAR